MRTVTINQLSKRAMKYFLFFLFLFSFFLAACNKGDLASQQESKETTTFTLSVEQTKSRATSSITPKRYVMEVWSEDGTTAENVFENGTTNHAQITSGSSFTITLDRTKAYVCLFWADDNETFDASQLKAVALNTGKEMNEAYFARISVDKGKKPDVAVKLKRAVAKITLTEKDFAKEEDTIALKFSGIFPQFNVMDSSATGTPSLWEKTIHPSATTGLIGTLYFFAKPETELTEFKFTYASEAEKTITNVPYQQNYATNIKGEYSVFSLFSFSITATDDWAAPDNEAELEQSVYIGGCEYNEQDIPVAKYWKDGVAVTLTDGTQEAYVNSIFIANGNVYAAGYEVDATTKNSVAKYWINDKEHEVALSDGTTKASANSIFVNGDQVYVAGYERDGVSPNRKIAKYWINDKEHEVELSTHYSEATAITISEGKIYVAGYVEREVNSIKNTICTYWTEGVETEVSDPMRRGLLYSIAVSGGDVYVTGNETNEENKQIAKYWKNSKENEFVLSDPGTYASGASIFVSGNDVYVAGSDTNSKNKYVAKYWKNNREGEVILSPQTGFYTILGGCISDSGILAVGICQSPYGGIFWRNGVEEVIPATYSTEFCCVAVK